MTRTLLGASLAALIAGNAHAETIGVTMQSFNDNFQTLLRLGIEEAAAARDGVDVQVENSQRDVSRQVDQVNNFIASGVDAIIVTLADTSAAAAITGAAEAAGVPLVYVNLTPANLEQLPDNQAYVGSDEFEAGRLGAEEACRLLTEQGKTGGAAAYIIMGDLALNASLERTEAVREVLAREECSFIEIIDAQQAEWLRDNAMDLMTNWLSAAQPFDAVFSNNDEMAIGAVQAMKGAGIPMEDVIVVGVDATQDGLLAMASGELDVTAFQNAKAQAAGAVDAALALAGGEAVEPVVHIPFELVTPANMTEYAGRN